MRGIGNGTLRGPLVLSSICLMLAVPRSADAKDGLQQLMTHHCIDCHNESTTEGELDLDALSGHGGGAIRGGTVLDFAEEPEERQRACNLYLSIAELMGANLRQFGDSVGPLPGLA